MMHYNDTLINDYTDIAFQNAYQKYCVEMGCHVTNWAGLFAGMSEAHREYTWTHRDDMGRVVSFIAWLNEDARDYTWVRKDEFGTVVGFIQFALMDIGSWFFREKCGFIREFWITPELRRQGHGTDLLQKAEEWLGEQGCGRFMLTTDTASFFTAGTDTSFKRESNPETGLMCSLSS